MSEKYVLGVDIGGTKVAAGLVGPGGEIHHTVRVPMNASGTASQALACVLEAVDATLERAAPGNVSAIGLSSPGPLDPRTGVVLHTPNLPCWKDFPLRGEIERAYGIPTRLDNDANAAGLAEALWGAGKGFSSVFYVTIGTGIGTAIVLDQQVYYGRTGAAAEGGHMTLDFHAPVRCGCGKRGCLEGMASGPAIAALAQSRAEAAPERGAHLRRMAAESPQGITAQIVLQASSHGDPLATEVLTETVQLLTIWLGNVIDLLEPDAIVVGGGLGSEMGAWFQKIRDGVNAWSINSRASEIPLFAAHYGADAGIAGSGALWLNGPAAVRN